jgi:menaquinone-dependent protoporphyrinogen oxidase
MSFILIAFATDEGQTAKVARALADQLRDFGHTVRLSDLQDRADRPDPELYDAVIVAASVHAGRHQKRASRFVRQHRDALVQRATAFLSVSMSAASTTDAGRQMADEQVQVFLRDAGWQPQQVGTIAGALQFSRLSWVRRGITLLLAKVFRKELRRLGWPEDLTRDAEFTDWDALRRFGERFAAGLSAGSQRASG